MKTKELQTENQKPILKKFGERYFLPLDSWNYYDLLSSIFFISIIGYITFNQNYFFSVVLVLYTLTLIIYIKDRFFIEIKTSNSIDGNIALIKDLALRQNNFSESLEQKGLFVFDYEEKNVLYKYNLRTRDHTESVIIYCENNSIWINSYSRRYLGLFRRYNYKQWIKLLQLKTQ